MGKGPDAKPAPDPAEWTSTPSTLVSDDPAVVDEVLDRGALAAAAQAALIDEALGEAS